jgi:hypothetical protein
MRERNQEVGQDAKQKIVGAQGGVKEPGREREHYRQWRPPPQSLLAGVDQSPVVAGANIPVHPVQHRSDIRAVLMMAAKAARVHALLDFGVYALPADLLRCRPVHTLRIHGWVGKDTPVGMRGPPPFPCCGNESVLQ